MKSRSRLGVLPLLPSQQGERPSAAEAEKHKLIAANERLQHQVSELEQKLSICLLRLDDLEKHTKLRTKAFEVSDTEIGILRYLQLCQKSNFKRKFFSSQSSAELFGIVNPDSQNYYGSPDKGDAWVQFEFPCEVTVYAFLIQSYLSCFIKSYRMISINEDFSETVLYSTNAETGLKGELKEVVHRLEKPVKTRKIRFEQTGRSWTDKNFIGIKRMDFRTNQCEGYYLEHLMKCVGGDPHKIPVQITSRYFDVYSFTMMNPSSYICTFDSPSPSWFQVEIAEGRVSVVGYRIKRHEALKIRSWTIRGSNDPTLELDKWTEVDRVEEEKEGPLLKTYRCKKSSPFKFIRLVMAGPGWNDRDYLAFWHFELFGDYIIDE